MLAARLCVYRPAGCRGKDVDEPLDVGDQGVPGGAQGGADPPRSGADTGTSGRPTARRGHARRPAACHPRMVGPRPPRCSQRPARRQQPREIELIHNLRSRVLVRHPGNRLAHG